MIDKEHEIARFSVELLFPDLYPQAVIYSLFEKDPISLYKDNLKEILNKSNLSSLDSISRNNHLIIAWDRIFETISGRDALLASPKDIPHPILNLEKNLEQMEMSSTVVAFSSNVPFGTRDKWITSRAHSHHNRIIAWCFQIELKNNSRISLILSSENCIDLNSI